MMTDPLPPSARRSTEKPRHSSEHPSAPPKIIFLGNGPLADAAESVLSQHFDIVFHARAREDLATVERLKSAHPRLPAILASYGQIIKPALLALFEPEGILNIHPSLLPRYRGPSPIETAILNGDHEFGVSVMKLVAKMDAGPLYYQTALPLPLDKAVIYRTLAETGANWLVENLAHLPSPTPKNYQNATYTQKITKNDAKIDPATESAETILRKIVAFQGFPKVRFPFYGQNCLILAAHLSDSAPTPLANSSTSEARSGASTAPTPELSKSPTSDPSKSSTSTPTSQSSKASPLSLTCADGQTIIIDRLQPEGRKAMDAQSFLNGYAR